MQTGETEQFDITHEGRATSSVRIEAPFKGKEMHFIGTFESGRRGLVKHTFTPSDDPGDNYRDRFIPLGTGASGTPVIKGHANNSFEFAMTSANGNITGNLDYKITIKG